MDEQYVLQMKNITKKYYGNTVLKNVNLNIHPGEILALIGENGAGKSTLMNVLFGMEQIHNTGGFDGEIIVNDNNEWECPNCGNKDHAKMNVTRRTCGYLGENFWNVGKTKEIKQRVTHL